jgi:2',3'-cyclic-nucleotide 2'-phosphodiesterase (5'-nucleotidase family)
MRTAAALVVAALFASCTTMRAPETARFKILQINDVYKIEGLEGGNSGGLARVRSLRKHLQSDGTPVLVLHGGDLLYPSVMSKFLEARPMVDVLNLLDGDASKDDEHLLVTFGNHEFDNRDPKILMERMKESQFRWVSANTRWCNPACDQKFPGQTDVVRFQFNGVQVAILGLLYPIRKPYVQSFDPIGEARDAVEALRRNGVDVVIALTHEDMPDDVALLQAVPGISLVIGGHDHLYMQQRVGESWITKADADAKSVIVYDVTVGPQGVSTTPVRVTLDATVPKDADVDARVQHWLGELSGKLGGNETIGTTRNLLEGVEPVVRGRESALGNLLADAVREQMQTDIAFINGGSIRINDNIPPGPITSYDMEGIFYFKNSLVATRLTGQQLLDILRNAVSRADSGDGRFLQVSGLSFTYRPAGAGFEVTGARIGGKPLDPNATYTAATLDYLYQNGQDDGFTLFVDGTRPQKVNVEREADFRTVVEKYIRARGAVDTDVEGRIVRQAGDR